MLPTAGKQADERSVFWGKETGTDAEWLLYTCKSDLDCRLKMLQLTLELESLRQEGKDPPPSP